MPQKAMMSSLAFTVNIPLGKQALWPTKGNKDVFANWWDKYFRGIASSTASVKRRVMPFSAVTEQNKDLPPSCDEPTPGQNEGQAQEGC